MPRHQNRPPLPPRASAAWRPSQREAKPRKSGGSPFRRMTITLGSIVLIFFAWRIHGRYVGASSYELEQFLLGILVFLFIAIAAAALTVLTWKGLARLLRRPGTRILDKAAGRTGASTRPPPSS